MNIEKLILERADKYIKETYDLSDELVNVEGELFTQLGETQFIEQFKRYEKLMRNEVMENVENAYQEGFKNGLELITSILDLEEPNKVKLKEAAIGKRAS